MELDPLDIAKPIERPGVTVNKSLVELLHLTPESPAAIEWAERMAEPDRISRDT